MIYIVGWFRDIKRNRLSQPESRKKELSPIGRSVTSKETGSPNQAKIMGQEEDSTFRDIKRNRLSQRAYSNTSEGSMRVP